MARARAEPATVTVNAPASGVDASFSNSSYVSTRAIPSTVAAASVGAAVSSGTGLRLCTSRPLSAGASLPHVSLSAFASVPVGGV